MFGKDLQTKIEEFAISKGSLSIPEIQVEFNLAYKEVAPIVHKLCEENYLSLDDGSRYVVCDALLSEYADRNYEKARRELLRRMNLDVDIEYLIDEDGSGTLKDKHGNRFRSNFRETNFNEPVGQEFQVKVLAFCIEEKEISLSSVVRKFRCNFIKAGGVLNKLSADGYIMPVKRDERVVYLTHITKKQCLKKFGNQYPELFDTKENGEELLKKLNKRLSESRKLRPKSARQSNEKITKKMPKSYTSMFRARFNMQMSVSRIPDMDKKVDDIIARAQKDISIYGGEWNSSKTFESVCMDVIEKLVGMDKRWRRMDAVKEAAKELIAVDCARQSRDALSVHSRVLYELLDGTDEDYELLKNKLWG